MHATPTPEPPAAPEPEPLTDQPGLDPALVYGRAVSPSALIDAFRFGAPLLHPRQGMPVEHPLPPTDLFRINGGLMVARWVARQPGPTVPDGTAVVTVRSLTPALVPAEPEKEPLA